MANDIHLADLERPPDQNACCCACPSQRVFAPLILCFVGWIRFLAWACIHRPQGGQQVSKQAIRERLGLSGTDDRLGLQAAKKLGLASRLAKPCRHAVNILLSYTLWADIARIRSLFAAVWSLNLFKFLGDYEGAIILTSPARIHALKH